MNFNLAHPQIQDRLRAVTRRRFLKQCGTGMGALALASLLNERLFGIETAASKPGAGPVGPHFAPKAKNIIYLFM